MDSDWVWSFSVLRNAEDWKWSHSSRPVIPHPIWSNKFKALWLSAPSHTLLYNKERYKEWQGVLIHDRVLSGDLLYPQVDSFPIRAQPRTTIHSWLQVRGGVELHPAQVTQLHRAHTHVQFRGASWANLRVGGNLRGKPQRKPRQTRREHENYMRTLKTVQVQRFYSSYATPIFQQSEIIYLMKNNAYKPFIRAFNAVLLHFLE